MTCPRNIPETYPKPTQNVPETSPKHSRNNPDISPKRPRTILETSPQRPRNVPCLQTTFQIRIHMLGIFLIHFSPTRLALGFLQLGKGYRIGLRGEPVPPRPGTGSPSPWMSVPQNENIKMCLGTPSCQTENAISVFDHVFQSVYMCVCVCSRCMYMYVYALYM